ncbi:hypothetical protein CHELA20_51118 [Hyphomicrobiales bacterium]|nr:hypothetical protein CHELA20_51118 [Hyphomicrobiales bacterium]CAH1673937.1 hypothetical protein CHELA41_23894 [Hyphomicrobiales bacterium]
MALGGGTGLDREEAGSVGPSSMQGALVSLPRFEGITPVARATDLPKPRAPGILLTISGRVRSFIRCPPSVTCKSVT